MTGHVIEIPALSLPDARDGPLRIDLSHLPAEFDTKGLTLEFLLKVAGRPASGDPHPQERAHPVLALRMGEATLCMHVVGADLEFSLRSPDGTPAGSRTLKQVLQSRRGGDPVQRRAMVIAVFPEDKSIWLRLGPNRLRPDEVSLDASRASHNLGLYPEGGFGAPVSLSLAAPAGAHRPIEIAELRLWSRSRLRQEADPQSTVRLVGNEKGLVGYWPVEEDETDILTDWTGNGADVPPGRARLVPYSGLYLDLGDVDARLAFRQELLKQAEARAVKLDEEIGEAAREAEAAQRLLEEKREALREARAEATRMRQEAVTALETKRAEIEQQRAEIIARLEKSRSISWGSLITQVERDISAAMENSGEAEYQLDNIAVDLKVVPGIGGHGLHLPPLDQGLDPDRFSTLTVRLSRRKTDTDEPRTEEVPDLRGYTERFARRKLSETGFRARVLLEGVPDSESGNIGRVFAQEPQPGEMKEAGSTIDITVGTPAGQSVAVND